MADIELRFHTDMLAISSPLIVTLKGLGVDVSFGESVLSVIEDEAVESALRLQANSGAPCIAAPTVDITRARLAHHRAAERDKEIAQAALTSAQSFHPQHLIAPIGATGLPIDPTSSTSLKANRDQYARAVSICDAYPVDAFLFEGLRGVADVRCALMGARMKSATPVMVVVPIEADGCVTGLSDTLEEVVEVAQDLEANVVGFSSNAPLEVLKGHVQRIAHLTSLPIIVEVPLTFHKPPSRWESPSIPWSTPDQLAQAVPILREVGVQFVRPVGNATPAFSGALAAACFGLTTTR